MNSALTHSAADIISRILETSENPAIVALMQDYKLCTNHYSVDAPNSIIVISDTEATDRVTDLQNRITERPGVQVRVRGEPRDQTTGRAALLTLDTFLLETLQGHSLTYESASYTITFIARTSGIVPLPPDPELRWDWTFNCAVRVIQTA